MLSFDIRPMATLAQFDECVILSIRGDVANARYRVPIAGDVGEERRQTGDRRC
jgi:hypothetical protein